jgi:putative glutamine amidotransferase
VDVEQDAFDLAVAGQVLAADLPLPAICRGTQVVNVALGGDIERDVTDHQHRTHRIAAVPGTSLDGLTVSCYHHQCLGRVGGGLEAVAWAEDGVIEAVRIPDRRAWFLGTQWHPEDTAAHDTAQAGLFAAFAAAARDPRDVSVSQSA